MQIAVRPGIWYQASAWHRRPVTFTRYNVLVNVLRRGYLLTSYVLRVQGWYTVGILAQRVHSYADCKRLWLSFYRYIHTCRSTPGPNSPYLQRAGTSTAAPVPILVRWYYRIRYTTVPGTCTGTVPVLMERIAIG